MKSSILRGYRLVVLAFLALPALKAGAAGQDAAATWQQITQVQFDPEKSAISENITLVRDRIRITLVDGTIQFAAPIQGIVYGAAFRGRGRVEVQPPNRNEEQQLRQAIGKQTLAMDFNEATLTFSDQLFEEIAPQVRWRASSDKRLEELYQDRQAVRENVGAEIVPRLFKSILSSDRKRTGFFLADLKTLEKGWVQFCLDSLEPEEVSVGRFANWGSVTRFDQWLSFPANGQSSSEAFANPLAREDFDIARYHIDAKITAGAEFSATTKVDISEKVPNERVLLFHLDANLRVDSVKGNEGVSLPFFQPRDPKNDIQPHGDYVAVVLLKPTAAGTQRTLEFSYSGKHVVERVGLGNYFCQSYGWYPSRPTHFAARSDFEMTFRLPKRFTLVATGNKTAETKEGDWSVTTWKSSTPLSVAGFAFGLFKNYTEKTGNITIDAYANPEPDDTLSQLKTATSNSTSPVSAALASLSPAAMIKTMGTEMGNTIRLFERYFGPYPYERLAVTNIPYSYGQGWPMLIYLSALSFMDSTQRHAIGIRDQIELSDFFRAHESSHQWWGHRVGWKSYHDQWLSEGFAQFSGNLYVQYRQNENEWLRRLKKDKEELLTTDERSRVFESIGPVWMGTRLSSSDSPRAYSTIVYNKGGLILHALRRLLHNPQSRNTDDRFIAMMQDFCQTYHNKAASTEDFKSVVEKHMIPVMDLEGNKRMDWFFRQYVYGTGVPHYQLVTKVEDAGGGQWWVTGKIVQSEVPPGWLDTVPIYLHAAGKTVRFGLIGIKQKENEFSFSLPIKPDKLTLNHFEDTIAAIR